MKMLGAGHYASRVSLASRASSARLAVASYMAHTLVLGTFKRRRPWSTG